MDKPKPHFTTSEGEEVYRENRPADNQERLGRQNIIEGYRAMAALKKAKGEKTVDFDAMTDEEIMKYHQEKPQEVKEAA